ncbi:MAG: heat-inducible transcription repressor HrcA, partial [Proteobacteria bacterium]|nr:heat-inducible transcription repressor HrcA [Pseudomonadota bacterium]
EPVGSRTICKRYGIQLSPATVRNVMADLEDLGFLWQPHTSAGRIPTDKAFRFYVDQILNVESLSHTEREKIRRKYRISHHDIPEMMRETSRILSGLSSYAGVVLTPKMASTIFKHIQFIRLNLDQILAVFVTSTGVVQNRIIQMENNLSQDELDKISRYLNEMLEGLTLARVRERILREMEQERIAYDNLMKQALKLGYKAFSSQEETELYIEGKMNILDEPEFANIEKMKSLFRAFEEKSLLITLLDKCLAGEGVQVTIGSESECSEMEGCSLVSSPYGRVDQTVGILGILGPRRMNYSRVIPLVEYTAKLLTKILESE